MNRALIFGIAIFFAVVGIALLGTDNSAVAGHGCNGCGGGYDCGGCGGGGGGGCHGGGLFSRLRNRGCHGCHGGHHQNDCCGQVVDHCQQDCCQPVQCCGNGYDAGYQGQGYGAPPAEGPHGVPGPAVEAPAAPAAPPAPAAPQAQRGQFRFRQVSFRR